MFYHEIDLSCCLKHIIFLRILEMQIMAANQTFIAASRDYIFKVDYRVVSSFAYTSCCYINADFRVIFLQWTSAIAKDVANVETADFKKNQPDVKAVCKWRFLNRPTF